MLTATALTCKDLTFCYQKDTKPVFAGLSFTLQAGEAVLLSGPSGCGKSTLAYCLAGLYPEYAGSLSGEINYPAGPLAAMPAYERAQQVAILFQNPDDQFCMDRVDREILFALENINYQGDMQARLQEVLALVGLSELAGAKLEELSGGTKQKVALACVLAIGAQTLILDEPFANVDPQASREIAARLAELRQTRQLSLLIIDHKATYWQNLATRLLLMDAHGQLVSDCPAPPFPGLESRYTPIPRTLPPRRQAAIKAESLALAYGTKQVLHELSLEIPQGRLTALLGENGSGKTSLLWAFAGLRKYQGRLQVRGKIGLVFQSPGCQFLRQKVVEEIILSLHLANPSLAAPEQKQQALALLAEFRLEPYAESSPYMLSQGQQRRLAVLAMLAARQDILLLDEPTYAQDTVATRFIMELLAERVAQGLTAVISTHDHELAAAYAQEIFTLNRGRIIARHTEGVR